MRAGDVSPAKVPDKVPEIAPGSASPDPEATDPKDPAPKAPGPEAPDREAASPLATDPEAAPVWTDATAVEAAAPALCRAAFLCGSVNCPRHFFSSHSTQSR